MNRAKKKVRQVFHKDAKITGYMQGSLMEQSVDSFAKFVASQTPSAAEKNEEKTTGNFILRGSRFNGCSQS